MEFGSEGKPMSSAPAAGQDTTATTPGGRAWAWSIACVLAVALVCVACTHRTADASPDPESLQCLALTLYWEARSDGRDGMLAVGWVVLNRLRSADYPKTICAVVRQGGEHKGCQFSYWCDGNSDKPNPDEAWHLAQEVAHELLTNPPPDPTHGALYYHDASTVPSWAHEFQQTARIGKHVYYRKA